jgi:hypothetical protein
MFRHQPLTTVRKCADFVRCSLVRLEMREKSKEFIERIKADPPYRIPGTAVVLGRMATGVPLALTRNVKVNHVLHERVLLVAVEMTETPRVADEDRVQITPISDDIARAELRFGFMEKADVPKGLKVAVARGQIPRCDLAQGDLLHGSRDDHSDPPPHRDGAMARGDLRAHASQRSAARRLFQYSVRPGHGNLSRRLVTVTQRSE